MFIAHERLTFCASLAVRWLLAAIQIIQLEHILVFKLDTFAIVSGIRP
jgi:hypothetical protein